MHLIYYCALKVQQESLLLLRVALEVPGTLRN